MERRQTRGNPPTNNPLHVVAEREGARIGSTGITVRHSRHDVVHAVVEDGDAVIAAEANADTPRGCGGNDVVDILSGSPWLTYERAAAYTGWSIRYLRNLVSADAIPVFGESRSRRFRRDMLDLYLTNRDAAMRKFRLERSLHHGN